MRLTQSHAGAFEWLRPPEGIRRAQVRRIGRTLWAFPYTVARFSPNRRRGWSKVLTIENNIPRTTLRDQRCISDCGRFRPAMAVEFFYVRGPVGGSELKSMNRSARLFLTQNCFSSIYRSHSAAGLRRIGLAAAIVAGLGLSACVESQTPLLTDAQPLLGQQFEVHLYENFSDKKASEFHTAAYQWKDGSYVRGSGLARDVKRFVAQPLEGNDFLLQSTDNTNLFNYWLGRKLAVGVYLVIPLDETDADGATRTTVCGKDTKEGICRVGTYEQLLKMARATAAKPAKNAALGVVLDR
jgi:hypothetical protein